MFDRTTDHVTHEQKTWTLTDTPKSTPLMAVSELSDTPRTEVWTVNEIPESDSLDTSFTTSSLSDSCAPSETPRSESLTSVSDFSSSPRASTPPCDLSDKSVPSLVVRTTQSRLVPSTSSHLTIPESSSSTHPCTSKESSLVTLHPDASDELTRNFTMATNSPSSSTESCKTPVAPRNEVVITMEDDEDEEMINEKSQREVLSAMKGAVKEASRNEVVITMEHDDEGDSLMLSQYEASSGKMIYMSEKPRMDNRTDDAIIDIMTSDDENEDTLVVNDNYNDGELLLVSSEPSNEVRGRGG